MEWITIADYPLYEINADGIVRNQKTGHIQKKWIKGNTGEVYYLLVKDKFQVRQNVYDLVAKTFLPNPNGWTRILVKDGNNENCSAQNLEWADDIMDTEKWDQIKGFDDYEINRNGQVRNKKTKRILGKNTDTSGYPVVYLRIDGKAYHKLVHVLVAEQYLPNPEHKPVVNHIDQNRSNNCVGNLEWATVAENNQHGTRGERIGARASRPINEYDTLGKYIRTWISAAAFLRHYGMGGRDCGAALTGSAKTVAGRQVRYFEGDTNDIQPITLNNYDRKYDYTKPIPSECLYNIKSERELVMEAIDSPLSVNASGKTKEKNAQIIKAYINKLESEIRELKQIKDSTTES